MIGNLIRKARLRPFLKKLFGTFILIAGIPLVFITILNHILITQLYTAELGESYKEKLRIADTIVSMWEEEMMKQAFIISMNEYQNSLRIESITPNRIMDFEIISNILRLSSLLDVIANTSNKFNSISIHYEGSDFIIYSSPGFLMSESTNLYEIFESLGGIGWLNLERTESPGTAGQFSEYRLGYVIPLLQYVSQNRGYIFFDIDNRELNNVINGGMDAEGGQVFIMDPEGIILSNADRTNIGRPIESTSAAERIINSSAESGFFSARMDGQNFFVVYRYSAANDWYYCSFISASELNQRTGVIYAITIGVIVILLVLTISFSYFSAKKLDVPVEKLEYRLEDYNLIQMLSGIRDAEASPVSSNLFPFPDFCCAVLFLDHYKTLRDKHGDDQIEKYKAELQKKCQEKLSLRLRCGILTLEPNSIAVIMNFRDMDLSFLPDFFREIQASAYALGLSLSVGIGKIYQGQNARLAYNSAHQALLRLLITGPGSLILYEERMEMAKGYYYPYDHESIIFNHLQLHSFSGVSQALGAFFRAIREEKLISVDNVFQACNQLLGGIIKYIVVLGINSRMLFDDEHNLYLRLSEYEFLDEIENFFKEILEKIVLFELREPVQKSPIDKIMAYIKTNCNMPFDLNQLSDDVGLSYSHVRRVFTKETGESILNYVYKMKIELAKKMLLEREISVSEIPEKLGFYNKQSFYRFFKKFEGITPTKYRELSE